MSTRQGGVSPEPLGMNLSFRVGDKEMNVEENRRRFFGALGFGPHKSAIPHQCHSDHVEIVTEPGDYESCDALITTTPDLPLVITVADCLPVILFDPKAGVVANVHAGWRGSAHAIVRKAVALMQEEFAASPERIIAYLGPSAGVCCYEVGEEVAGVFPSDHREVRGGRIYLNLKKTNVVQLRESGLRLENIEVSESCTICAPNLYHSHRRDRERSGRMMAVVSLVKNKGV